MVALRRILLATPLTEKLKWGKPCYVHGGENIVILQEMSGCVSLMFFKGALLDDPEGVLVDQGPNSRSARRIEFTSPSEVDRLADTLATYVAAAIEVAEAGLSVGPPPPLVLADELQALLDGDPRLASAFDDLTPGRQREYNLHISGAKKPSTRTSRAEASAPRILAGKGLRDG